MNTSSRPTYARGPARGRVAARRTRRRQQVGAVVVVGLILVVAGLVWVNASRDKTTPSRVTGQSVISPNPAQSSAQNSPPAQIVDNQVNGPNADDQGADHTEQPVPTGDTPTGPTAASGPAQTGAATAPPGNPSTTPSAGGTPTGGGSTWSGRNGAFSDASPASLRLNAVGTGTLAPYCMNVTYTGDRTSSGFGHSFATLDSSRWKTMGTGSVSASGVLTLATPANGSLGGYTRAAYDMRDSSVAVKVVGVPGGGGQAWLQLHRRAGETDDWGQNLAIYYNGRTRKLVLSESVNWTFDQTALPWNPATMAYWRIMTVGQNVYWQTSANGSTWTTRKSKLTSLDLSSMSLDLETQTLAGDTLAQPRQAQFDDFRLARHTYARLFATTTTALGSAMTITVEQGSGGSADGSCAGFRPTSTVYRGPLSGLGSTYATGVGTTTITARQQTVSYRISGTLPSPTTNTATTTFTWQTQPR